MHRKAAASLTEQLTAGLARPVDPLTRARAVWHWLDWMGCIAVARRAPAAQALLAWRLPGWSARAAPWHCLAGVAHSDMQAVCLEAGLANVEEMDDMHREAILHPGPVVLPVVAHLARHEGLSLARALDAVVHGYETMIRIGRSFGPAHYNHWHNTATAGAFGAAAAAAHALALTPEQTVWALGNAGTQAAGLWQVRLEPVMSKQLHTGHAAWAGLTAATLARAGFTGPRHILEGEQGVYAAMCADARPQRLLASEADWLIHSTSFKPWPACRHTHAAIDAALALREQHGDRVCRVQRIDISTYADALRMCDQPSPRQRIEAKFSLQYAVSAALRHGPLQPRHFDAPALADSVVARLVGRCKLQLDQAINAAYPNHYGAEVRLVWDDGSTARCRFDDALGDPPRPLSEQQRRYKATELMTYGNVPVQRQAAALRWTDNVADTVNQAIDMPVPSGWLDPLIEETQDT